MDERCWPGGRGQHTVRPLSVADVLEKASSATAEDGGCLRLG